MWFRLIVLSMVFNGVGDFGLRVLQELGYASQYSSHYLIGWYAAGALGALVSAWRWQAAPKPVDWLIGLGLGACSFVGQLALGSALGAGVSGSVAYPVAKTGGVFLVAGFGVIVFREALGRIGIVGVVLGLCGVLLVSLE